MSEVPERVDLYMPQGGFATAPRDSLPDALEAGGKVVKPEDAELFRSVNKGRVVVYDAEGRRATVPREQLKDALADNFRVATYDEAVSFLREKEAKKQPIAPQDLTVEEQDILDSFQRPTAPAHVSERPRPISDMSAALAATAPGGSVLPEVVPALSLDEQTALASFQNAHLPEQSFTDLDTALTDPSRLERERAIRRAREAEAARLQEEYGAQSSVGGAVGTVGESLARVGSLGFDAPMAAAQTAVADAVDDYTRDPANTYQQELPVGQARDPGLLAGIRPEIVAGIQGRAEANPVLDVGTQVAGAALIAAATGGASLGAQGTGMAAAEAAPGFLSLAAPGLRQAVRAAPKVAPAGWFEAAAARAGVNLGTRTGGLIAGETGLAASTGLRGALARTGAASVRIGTEAGFASGLQGAGAAVNDAWLANDGASAWEYAGAGVRGLGLGTMMGGGAGIGMGAALGLGSRAFGEQAQRGMIRRLGLTGDAVLSEPPVVPTELRGHTDRWLRVTPTTAEKGRLAVAPSLRKKLDELLDLNRKVQIDPTQPPPLRPKDVERLNEATYKELQPDLDEFVAIKNRLSADPDAPPPLTPKQEQAYLDSLYNEAKEKSNEFVQLNNKLEDILELRDKHDWVRANASTTLSGGKWSRQQLMEHGNVPDDATLERLANEDAIKFSRSGAAGAVKLLRKQIASQIDKLVEAQKTRALTTADLHIAYDQVRRDLGTVVAFAKDREKLLYNELSPVFDRVRAGLMDDTIWPEKLVDAQRRGNATWSRSIAADQDSELRSAFGTVGKQAEWDGFTKPERMNDSFLSTHMKSVGAPEAETRREVLDYWYNAKADDAVTRAQIYGSPEAQQTAKRLAQLRGELGSVYEKQRKFNLMKRGEFSPITAATVAGEDQALSGMINKSGAFDPKNPMAREERFNADWVKTQLRQRGDAYNAQTEEAFDRFMATQVDDAKNLAFSRGERAEDLRDAARLAELQERISRRLGEAAERNAVLRVPERPLTAAEQARADGNLGGMFIKRGAADGDVFDARELPDGVNPDFVTRFIRQAGKPGASEEAADEAFLRMVNTHADEAIEIARARGTKEAAEIANRAHQLRREVKNIVAQASELNRAERPPSSSAPAMGKFYAEFLRDAIADRIYSRSIKTLEQVDQAATLKSLVGKAQPTKSVRPALNALANADKIIGELFDDSPETQQREEQERKQIEDAIGPDLLSAAQQHKDRVRMFLVSKAGGAPSDPAARARMQRYAPAAAEPLKAIDRMADGTATQEDREAVRDLYPALHTRFMQQALVTVQSQDLTYDQKLKASRSIGLPLESSLRPERYVQLQSLAASSPSSQEQQSDELLSPSRRRPPQMSRVISGR